MLFKLNHRCLISLNGDNRFTFLQGLITQDVSLLQKEEGTLLYSLLLSSRGKIQYDLFLFDDGSTLYIDTDRRDDLLKLLNFYKLRSHVDIEPIDLSVYVYLDDDLNEKEPYKEDSFFFSDPRHEKMGFRFYTKKTLPLTHSISDYDNYRVQYAIPDGVKDLKVDQFFALEWKLDCLSAISFTKGCYLGQEQTARTKHLDVLRKNVALCDVASAQFNLAEKENRVISKYSFLAFILEQYQVPN
ncbi:MAG: tRNA-modifying protein YgfZ [Holosporales bacterium]